MKLAQKGFAAQGAVILLLVVAVLVGTGYVVMSRQNKQSNSESSEESGVTKKVIPVDGTPKSTVDEISSQVAKEVKIDDDSMKEEENESKIDEAAAKEVGDSVHETNL
jgi:uncharacterized protein HemX